MNWYQLKPSEVLHHLEADAVRGLSESEVTHRLARYGPNELVEHGLKSPWRILWEQLAETMVVVLIVAALISALLGDYKDAGAILVIVVLNAALGFRQEYRAEKAMAALKRLTVPTVKVRREARIREISARELVPGDLILLETGNLVSADGRLLETVNLRIQEASLTGESEPVEKAAELIYEGEPALGDRRNMAYMGTMVTYGHGLLVVTATGMATELGQIATLIQTVEREPTPLQQRLAQLGRVLAVVAIVIVTIVFGLGVLRGEEIKLMFLTAVSMAVAAVPEGLPAVVTIALALGAQKMLKRQALIRKLPAVETLGSVTVICSDKTGTLTKNQMTVTVLDIAGQTLDLIPSDNGWGFELVGRNGHKTAISSPALALLLTGGALCNDAFLEPDATQPNGYQTLGDPTEAALVVAAARLSLAKPALEQALPRVAEIPFDADRKLMTTVHRVPPSCEQLPEVLQLAWRQASTLHSASRLIFTKGAIDHLLELSTAVWLEDRAYPLTPIWRERILLAHDQLAQEGMRILGVAFRPLPEQFPALTQNTLERELILIGMIGMIDPPRPEVRAAVQTCQAAGIRPVMITGDHPLTARHIAAQLAIPAGEPHLTGRELSRMTLAELQHAAETVNVYARVSPEHKLRLVEALQAQGHIVAMTGDGVNDAPALKRADIGIAMGLTGTDVAKEAADMVLRDDNFATIVAAIEEGRVIYDNIRKFIKYLLTSNSGEIWVMFLAPFLGMPLPLLPLQILWINLVTDGLPALALSVEPAEQEVMRRPPYRPKESIFAHGMGWHIIWVGVVMGLVSLGLGFWGWRTAHPDWQTMLFTTLTLSQLAHVLAIRSDRNSLFTIGLLSNRPMFGAILLTFVLQLAVVYLPLLQAIFHTTPLSPPALLICLLLSSLIFWAVEAEKWVKRIRA